MIRTCVLFCILCLLSACRIQDTFPIEVERSTIYHGQTLASLYDNFGVPDKQYIDAYGIRELHYNQQSVLKKGVDSHTYFCDFIVYTDEGIVIDWKYRGNRCRIEEAKKDVIMGSVCQGKDCWLQETEKEFYLEE